MQRYALLEKSLWIPIFFKCFILAKQEEDEIIRREIGLLKTAMSSPEAGTGGKKLKEWLIRLIYCDMLGHDVAFGYIVAINATQMVANQLLNCSLIVSRLVCRRDRVSISE